MPTYANLHALLHALYGTTGQSLWRYARAIDWSARNLLQRARIYGNLSRAMTLQKVLARALTDAQPTEDAEAIVDRFELHGILTGFYDVMVDDLLLLSAFENHAKAVLLTNGHVVHEISQPSVLRKLQNVKPIHVRTIRSALGKGVNVTFSEKTIGIETLLKAPYLKKYPISRQVAAGISEIRARRNQIHFNSGYVWSVTPEVLATVAYLKSAIPNRKSPWSRT
jgi:hypothetical protein